ncbi:MAG: phosphate signaling complex protein PhoU [Desulfovibrionaceae bacterium]
MEQKAHFTAKLEELKMQVLRMAALSEKAVGNAVKAYMDRDADLAEEVIRNDCSINDLEDSIDKLSLEMLALDQPMAIDLRRIVGSSRITVNLERLGDEAVNLAHRALFMSTRPALPYNQRMELLAEKVMQMLSLALKAFVESDLALADKVCEMDTEADELAVKILKETIAQMVSETRVVERGVHAIMAARHLERVGDLATNVAESVVFIVAGDDVKHRCRG